jgi:predicted secreted hydrolase
MIMKQKNITIMYREKNHGTFDEEWPPHKKASGWWYITGYLSDKQNPNHLYSYQYTVAQGQVLGKRVYILHMAFSDLEDDTHLFKQEVRLWRGKKIRANYDEVVYVPYTILSKKQKELNLEITTEEFDLHLVLQKGKEAIWHCDNGVLAMGLSSDPKQRTVYYSYTNLPTEGTLIIRDKSGQTRELEVVGKSWFDRQYGPFRLLNRASHWEWFSFRFFDDEEIMLFYFPQHPYMDGTYIDKQGKTTRLQNYEIKPKDFVKKGSFNYTFSFGWDVIIPGIKEERYEIKPLSGGQFNIAYFELLAEVLNSKNERIGYCFVELICGARNELRLSQQIGNLMKKKNNS